MVGAQKRGPHWYQRVTTLITKMLRFLTFCADQYKRTYSKWRSVFKDYFAFRSPIVPYDLGSPVTVQKGLFLPMQTLVEGDVL